jgi:hypothetical protein
MRLIRLRRVIRLMRVIRLRRLMRVSAGEFAYEADEGDCYRECTPR